MMIDVKEKIKENQRKQRAVVDAFHKKIRDEAVPFLRAKKIAHSRRVDDLQDNIHEKWTLKKDSAREQLKAAKEKHQANVCVLGDTIKAQQKKQQANHPKTTLVVFCVSAEQLLMYNLTVTMLLKFTTSSTCGP